MFPLRDNIPSRRLPAVNYILIAANVAAFAYELSLGRHGDAFILRYGLIPLRFSKPWLFPHTGPFDLVVPVWTSMFLHGGWLHLISNMWCLFVFGDNVEDKMGHFRYLVFYLICGLAAGAAQTAVGWGSPVPVIGASGAIAGVMGAYFLLFPRARVLTVVPIFIFLKTVELPAWVFLGIWFAMQLFFGSLPGPGEGVAFWAHIGGFVGGVLLMRRFVRSRR